MYTITIAARALLFISLSEIENCRQNGRWTMYTPSVTLVHIQCREATMNVICVHVYINYIYMTCNYSSTEWENSHTTDTVCTMTWTALMLNSRGSFENSNQSYLLFFLPLLLLLPPPLPLLHRLHLPHMTQSSYLKTGQYI